MTDGSLASEALRAIADRGHARAGAERALTQLPPTPEGPSQAEMAANPTGAPVRIVRPQSDGFLQRAQMLLRQGLISPEQYEAYAAKVAAQPQGAQ